MDPASDTESLEAEPMAQSTAAAAQSAPSEDEKEEPPTPAPVKRGRPKGSKDAQPRTRKPTHTPCKRYVDDEQQSCSAERHTVHSPPKSTTLPSLRYFEEAMEHARQQEMTRRISLYTSWLPY